VADDGVFPNYAAILTENPVLRPLLVKKFQTPNWFYKLPTLTIATPPFRGAPIIVHTVLIAFSRANRRSKFKKRSQQFIRTHNKPLSVAAMCVHHARSIHYQS